jgi:hypothetical protein
MMIVVVGDEGRPERKFIPSATVFTTSEAAIVTERTGLGMDQMHR